MSRRPNLTARSGTAWQLLRESREDSEELAFEICRLIRKKDPMIGRVPNPRKLKKKTKR